jgi:hypothetical protein
MRDDRTTRSEPSVSRLLVFAGPLLWALLVLFHPMPGDGSPYAGIKNDVDLWLLVHVGQLILTPVLFLAVWRLLDGTSSAAATISRCALVVWTVFFSAYDAIQGVATGILIVHARGFAAAEQATVATAIDHLVYDNRLAGDISAFQLVAGGSWLIVAIAAAAALHRAGAGKAVVAAACLSTAFAAHTATAALGLLALSVAGVLQERRRNPSRAASAEASPAASPAGAPLA